MQQEMIEEDAFTRKVFRHGNGSISSNDSKQSNVSDLVNFGRLCKLKDNEYIKCSEYCCGEFWETSPSFCCPNDFRPIRNLFSHLLISFCGLFITIAVFLVIELLAKHYIVRQLKFMEELYQASNSPDMQMADREWSSTEQTSLDEDSSTDGSRSLSFRKPTRQILTKHSQNFKEMSRMKSFQRRQKGNVKNLT